MAPRRQSKGWGRLLAVMAFNPWTVQQLAEAFHLHRRSVHAYLKLMREDGLIYTCGWLEHSPGPPSRQWIMGYGIDVPPPPGQDMLEVRRRQRAVPGAKEREAMLKRNRRRLNKLQGKSIVAATLGV